ncbi:MAG: inverse autotransporter beta domain-containing protein, partial [Alphaproteobacteria bacterium]|nr:inverse autotransporter beta domain-containing protein [Alphaproteobacteria bacterium]
MRRTFSFKGAFGLVSVCLLALYGVHAVRGNSTWDGIPRISELPQQDVETLEAAETAEIYGPFETSDMLQPAASMRLLSASEGDGFLPDDLKALYLSDYDNDRAAMTAWEAYQVDFPVLHFFQPFALSQSQQDKTDEKNVSLIAILRKMNMPEEAAQTLSEDACSALRWHGHICAPMSLELKIEGLSASVEPVIERMEAGPQYPQTMAYNDLSERDMRDAVTRQHMMKRLSVAPIDEDNEDVFADIPAIEPAAGMYDIAEEDAAAGNTPYPLHQPAYEGAVDFEHGGDDTVAQAAMRAAYDLVRNRYEGAIQQARMNNGEVDMNGEDVQELSQEALNFAAERAFEQFMSESFGKRDFEGRTYDGLRGYFMASFKHAAATSIKSVGRRFVKDVTAGRDFKSFAIRSELLDGLDQQVAKAFIETGLAAAKNSQYAFLRNLEVSYKIRENNGPEYSVLTLQPLYSSEGRKHNLFAQASFAYEDSRSNISAGLGYRFLPESEDYVVGSNVFLDYQRPYNHLRASAGVDLQTSFWGASANYYKGLSDWKNTTGVFQERAQDGMDFELAGRMPFLPALEVFGRGYRWQGFDGVSDTDGKEFRVEYSPVPAFTLEGLVNDEEGRATELGLGLRYNYTFGAPQEYLYDWDEQFRKKSPSEYIFRKVSRENTIRVQKRVDPNAAPSFIPAGLLAFSPTNAATDVSVGTDISFTFDQDVQAGTGNIVITDLTDGSGTFNIPAGDARVMIVNDTVTLDLSAQLLEFSTNYEVTFTSGVFQDLNGNPAASLGGGDYGFTTIVDPTAGFPAPTTSVAPNTTVSNFEDAQQVGTWQTTVNVGAVPDGVIFESGATGQGIAASFGGGNLVFAAGDGSATGTISDAIFGSYPIASISQGLHHFVFVADPDAPAEIG